MGFGVDIYNDERVVFMVYDTQGKTLVRVKRDGEESTKIEGVLDMVFLG